MVKRKDCEVLLDNEYMRVSMPVDKNVDKDKLDAGICIEAEDEIPFEVVIQKVTQPPVEQEIRIISKKKIDKEEYWFVIRTPQHIYRIDKWVPRSEYNAVKTEMLGALPCFGRRTIHFGEIDPEKGVFESYVEDE